MREENRNEKHVRITDDETPVLQALAASVPDGGLIVEIGSANGYSCSKMAAACAESVRIYAIDPWTLGGQKQQPDREKRFHEMIAAYRHKVRPIKAFSQDVDLNEEIDLLFIDGNHGYEAVRLDYLRFAPLVKTGGWLVFHDYHVAKVPGVTRTIDELVIPSGEWEWHVEYKFWIGQKK